MSSRRSRITGSETSNLVDWLPGSTQAGSGFLRDGYYYMYNGGVEIRAQKKRRAKRKERKIKHSRQTTRQVTKKRAGGRSGLGWAHPETMREDGGMD